MTTIHRCRQRPPWSLVLSRNIVPGRQLGDRLRGGDTISSCAEIHSQSRMEPIWNSAYFKPDKGKQPDYRCWRGYRIHPWFLGNQVNELNNPPVRPVCIVRGEQHGYARLSKMWMHKDRRRLDLERRENCLQIGWAEIPHDRGELSNIRLYRLRIR